jgi:hypothetical protein
VIGAIGDADLGLLAEEALDAQEHNGDDFPEFPIMRRDIDKAVLMVVAERARQDVGKNPMIA